MKKAYFDCFAGISGDMITGAFIDSGFDFSLLEKELRKLNIEGCILSRGKTIKKGISATKFDVSFTSGQPHRSLASIIKLIEDSALHPVVKSNAISVFRIIGEAESRIHGIEIEKVHFHEIGAVDSIIDICAAAICFHQTGIDSVTSSPINTGSGTVKTAHGILPVPAPATAEILKGIPVYSSGIQGELTTPTGAAIIRHYSRGFSDLPGIKIESVGYGAGTKDFEIPNVLRIFIGSDNADSSTDDQVTELEASIDDMNPEYFSYLFELLLAEGALDVSVIPAVMKKNRPGHILKILAHEEKADNIAGIVFRETTTSGLRVNTVRRKVLERESMSVETQYGPVRVKIHRINGIPVTFSPEYEDCRRGASEYRVSLKKVYNEALIKVQTFF